MQELQPGDPQQIGSYRIVGRLGAGGMGMVFVGRSAGGRLVAVKVIREELAADPEFRVRFGREVALARSVSGVFTAAVVDADVNAPAPWLATAYVAGPSLADAVRQHGPLPAASVLVLAAGLAESLRAIHAASVVHRDLKPTNVLLAADGPRVIDFGISRATEASALTHTGFVIGSPGFMSPEQAEGREVGPPGDVFSLGALLVFAATGQGPFGTGSTAALVYRVVHSPPSLDGVPAELRPLIERCMAKEPGRRPTAGDLLAGLGDAHPAADWLPMPVTGQLSGYVPPDPAVAPTGGQPRGMPAAAWDGPATRTSAGQSRQRQPAPGRPPGPGPAAPRRNRRRLLQAAVIAGLMAASAAVTLVLANPARHSVATRPPNRPVVTATASMSGPSPGGGTAAPPRTLGTITPIASTNLSGYAVYPHGGTLTSVRASWAVPAVTCPAAGQPRVAVWAGLWGTNATVGQNAAWLPRIGTASQCDNGTASYSAFWEMDSDFPDSSASAENFQALPLPVSPGDSISAAVSYLGANSTGEREFRLTIADNSRPGLSAVRDLWTTVPVPLDAIAYQGGAIVEDHNQYGGLADFSQAPISFTDVAATGGSGDLSGFDYEMIVNGQLLAQNSALGGTFGPPPNAASLSVTFLCNGCLAGIVCPPPNCLQLPG